ncbi:MAG: Na/Pi symporter [Kiloniellales bacterium]
MQGSTIETVFTAAGGLALFLLAMSMMTDGLKVFGGQKLKVLLRDWTSSAIRGVLTGALVTAVVQSSGAVTVATIGFVNAGVLSLRQSLGVIFGSNVGTTMTAWLVSLVGFGFKIEPLALPILAIGVGIRFIASGKRLQGLGNAIAGFGLFFLGLAILKGAFGGFANTFGDDIFSGATGLSGLLLLLGIGFLATVLTQSSSAAIAIILTAATQNVVSLDTAAAAIIGANLGSTSTALLAVIGATPNAKRVAVGHLSFNLITGLIALAILPGVLVVLTYVSAYFGFGNQPALLLALFHTVFNMLGVALMLPFTGSMARRLDRLFRSTEEDLSRPQHLDKTVLSAPILAVAALKKELLRLRDIVCALAVAALESDVKEHKKLERRAKAAVSLSGTIAEFATSIGMETLPRAISADLPRVLRTSRYLEEVARLSPDAETLHRAIRTMHHQPTRVSLELTLRLASSVVKRCSTSDESRQDLDALDAALEDFEAGYQDSKAILLSSATTHTIRIELAESLLDALSRTRRLIDQLAKASRYLSIKEADEEAEKTALNDLEEPGDPTDTANLQQP